MATLGSGRRPGYVAVQEALRILVVAFLLNWIWEATHAAAYVESTGPFVYRLRHCPPMAGTDALWTLALWAIVTALWWGAGGQVRSRAALAVLGAATAIVVEWAALAEGRWTYNALMPIVPVVNVGLWPVAQMPVLPVTPSCWQPPAGVANACSSFGWKPLADDDEGAVDGPSNST